METIENLRVAMRARFAAAYAGVVPPLAGESLISRLTAKEYGIDILQAQEIRCVTSLSRKATGRK